MGSSMEDVGVRTKVEGASTFLRDSDRVNRAMESMAKTAEGSSRKASSAMSGFGSMLSAVVSGASKLGFAVFGFQQTAAAVQMAGDAALGASIQWEQFNVTMKTLTGSAELGRAKMEELSDFARKTPFTLPDVVSGAKSLLAYGFAAKDIVPMLTAVGDAAAGLGDDALPRIIRALGQMQARTKVSSQEMLQLTEAGVPAWRLLADAMGITVGELQGMVEKGIVPADAAITVLLSGLKQKFGGLMEEQSKTFGGMLSNLQDWVYRAKTMLMQGVFEGLKGQFSNLLKAIDTREMQQNLQIWGYRMAQVFNAVVTAVQVAARIIGPIISGLTTVISTAVGALGPVFGGLANVINNNLGTALQVSAVAIGVWATVVTTQAVRATYEWVAALVVATAAQAGFYAFAVKYYATIWAGQIKSVAMATASLIAYAATGVATALTATGNMILSLPSLAKQFGLLAVQIITKTVPAMLAYAVTAIGSTIANTPKLVASLGSAIKAFVVLAATSAASAASTAVAWVSTAVPAIAGAMAAIVTAIGPALLAIAAIGGAVALLVVAWQNNWGDIQGFTGRILGWLGDRISDFFNWLKSLPIVGGWVGQIGDWAGQAGKWIGDLAGQVGEGVGKVTKTAGDFMGNMLSEFQKGFPTLQKWFGDLFKVDASQAGAKEAIDDLMKGVDTSADKVNAAVQKLKEGLSGDVADAMKGLKSAAQEGITDAQDRVQGLTQTVGELTDALREAQDAMRGFADPRLTGMQEAEDQMFELDMAIKRAKLDELGKKVKKSAKDAGEGFDILSAQQRELAEGIPVAFQRAKWEAEQAKRLAEQAAKSGKKDDEETEAERLQRIRDMKQLEFDLSYEPQLRKLKETYETLTGANKELTFEEALTGLLNSAAVAETLKGELGEQEALLKVAKADLEAQQDAYRELQKTADDINDIRTNTIGTEDEILARVDTQIIKGQTMLDIYNQQTAALEAQKKLTAEWTPDKVYDQYGEYGSQLAGMAAGGTVTQGGAVKVGERGPEVAVLPSGTQVIPNTALRPASVSRSYSDTFHVYGANEPINVVDAIRRYNAFRNITQGRR